ncbi:hydrogen peroxide-inducible genes activator [uncultured Prevotella sp.]|uniref:hydrogen peroxide-inducible genes activator n=1 Tax=uncultured Prevotella sp. TaxID=159272 RepID=UPI0026109C59|nr:hydrogen peroxide-inducible genes activator [uncultured Prevotella sp.]
MTLQQMEYIVAVYRLRHFAKAAESCGVTQPTLSAMIQKLEKELGVKIFERSSQQVTPTAIGKLVVEQAWRVIARANKIKEIIAEEEHSLAGTFKIGILPTIAPYLLPRFFTKLERENPDIDFHIIEMKTADIKKALNRGEIDAAIAVRLEELDVYEQTSMYYEQFIAYVAKNDPLYANKNIKTSDLNNEFLWLLDEGHCFRDQLVRFCNLKSATESKSKYSLGSIETFMRMVESGQGVTFIPELALSLLSEQQKELVRPFALPIPVRDVVLLTTRNFVRHSIADLIVRSVRENVPQSMLTYNNREQRI